MKIQVKVVPKSKVESVTRQADLFVVRIKEPAKEGKANRAAIKLLADYLGIPQSAIMIIRGAGSRNKVIEIAER
jgi:uncharacterized protein (TIGR00251 family)